MSISKSKISTSNPYFHLWIPNIFEFKGGIQVYSNFLLQGIQRLYPNAKYELFLKHDTTCSTTDQYLANTNFHFSGKIPLPIRTIFFVTQLITNALKQKPELIIATHLNFTVAAYILKRLTGIPYWTTAYGMEAWNIKKPFLVKALQNADQILSISNYTRDRLLQEQNLDPQKISVLPCVFNPKSFDIKPKPHYLLEKYQLKSEQSVILTVARLAEAQRHKGYDQILQALPQIRQTIPNVHYLIVGKGKDRPRIESLIEELGLADCVTLAGFVPDEQLCDYYNLCDLFAMPSKKEGFGIVYLEAMACGKPALGGNQDGAVDALCQGELGALVNPDDIDEIAQTILQILQGKYPNSVIYQPEILRQKVIEKFGFKQFKRQLANLTKTILC